MIKEKIMSRSVRMMFSSGMVAGLSLFAAQALAQQAASDTATAAAPQRVEILGSAIKRINVEGALPVQTLSKAAIEQTGATTVADLIEALPSMQGFVSSSASINGGGGGVQTASIHGVGSEYTLVLLNGHRVASFGTGSAVNLASIPLSAVERVEILTDGASALYGSDAIAGVVNFVLKKNTSEGAIEMTYNTAEGSSNGATANIALSKGFGDLDSDGYNVLAVYSHDEQSELNASDRAFSAGGGIHQFMNNGQMYSLYQLSGNSIPGNVTVKGKDASGNAFRSAFNPSLLANGSCVDPNTRKVGMRCLFNYAATVELLPGLKRDGLLLSGKYKLNQDTTLFAEGLISKFTSTARYAPPAQPLGIDLNSALYQNYVAPLLPGLGIDPTKVTQATMNLRLKDAGGRTDGYESQAKHFVAGVEGTLKNVDYNVAYTHSQVRQIDNAVAGYSSYNTLFSLINAGLYNPLIPPSAATKAAIQPAVLHQVLDDSTSKLDLLEARAILSELFKTSGGAADLALGFSLAKQNYTDSPSAILQGTNPLQPSYTDAIVGGGAGALPFDANRKNWGTFAELKVPVIKGLEIDTSLRYDSYDTVSNSQNFDPSGNPLPAAIQGKKASQATYKIGAAYRPMDNFLIRGSYGTGFKAPSLADISAPIANAGSSLFHPCPITSSSDPLFALCNGTAEYGLLSGGNPLTGDGALKPEKSKQYTLGFRIEPTKSLSFGLDLWDVTLSDQITTLAENTVFGDPVKYRSLFSSYFDPIQKQNVLVATLSPFNLAKAHFRGIDIDTTFGTPTPMGKLTVNWAATYTLKADTDDGQGTQETSLGRFDQYNNVTFRFLSKLTASLKTAGGTLHSLTMNYHSGYHDAHISSDDSAVRIVNADGSLGAFVDSDRDVKSYTVYDWQTKMPLTKALTLTGGIKNIFDRSPPFSQRITGGGNMLGYDGRYTDPLGRQFYLVGKYKF